MAALENAGVSARRCRRWLSPSDQMMPRPTYEPVVSHVESGSNTFETHQCLYEHAKHLVLEVRVCFILIEVRNGFWVGEDDASAAKRGRHRVHRAVLLRPVLVHRTRVALERIPRETP